MKERGFLVSARLRRGGLRKIIEVRITDGRNDMIFPIGVGSFVVATDKPLKEPILIQDHFV